MMRHRTLNLRHPKASRGFTLMEVLVALAVVAIALSAILASSGRTTSNAAQLRDTTLAQWVAENRLTELRLEQGWPSTGRTRGEAEMGGREWFWTMEVEDTEDDNLRRIEVSVATAREAEGSTTTVLGFIGRPLPPPQPPVWVPIVSREDYHAGGGGRGDDDGDGDDGGTPPPPPP